MPRIRPSQIKTTGAVNGQVLTYDSATDSVVYATPTSPVTATTYTHSQAVAASVWTINHNLGFVPNVWVEDSAGTEVEGDIAVVSLNTITLTFSAAFGGTAYLS